MKAIDKKIILYVDDELGESRKEMLEETGKYLVINYIHHHEAEEDIENGLKFDVAIIDRATINSRTTGDDLMRFIKNKNPKIPIINISCYNTPVEIADENLFKPFMTKKLIECIEKVIKIK